MFERWGAAFVLPPLIKLFVVHPTSAAATVLFFFKEEFKGATSPKRDKEKSVCQAGIFQRLMVWLVCCAFR